MPRKTTKAATAVVPLRSVPETTIFDNPRLHGIDLWVRRYEVWALAEQLHFAELAQTARIARYIKSVYYDSNPQTHTITLKGSRNDCWFVVDAIQIIGSRSLRQFHTMTEAGEEVWGIGHGPSINKCFKKDKDFPAVWKAALSAELVDYDEFGNLLLAYGDTVWLQKLRTWALLDNSVPGSKELTNAQALADRTGHPVLLLDGPPADRLYWQIRPTSSGVHAPVVETEHDGVHYKISALSPFAEPLHAYRSWEGEFPRRRPVRTTD